MQMNKQRIFSILKVIAIPTIYALILRLFFGIGTWVELYSVMTVTFLFCLPTIVGILTVYFSKLEDVRRFRYRLMAPWVPILIFLVVTLFFALEGWACWLMVLPLFLAAASIGGLYGGYLKLKGNKRNGNIYVSVFAMLPLFMTPIESMIGKIPGTYKAYTFIDIKAPADKIWSNVTRVKEIAVEQDKGWLTRTLGFMGFVI